MYKPILAIEKKNNNMKRLAISFIPIIFLIFIMGNVNAYLVNFTGSTPVTLGIVNETETITARFDTINKTWIVSYYKFNENTYLSKWSNDYQTKYIDYSDVFGYATIKNNLSSTWELGNASFDNMILYVNDQNYQCTGPILNTLFGNVSYSSNTGFKNNDGGQYEGCYFAHNEWFISNNYLTFIHNYPTGIVIDYWFNLLDYSIKSGGNLHSLSTANGTLYIPSQYTQIRNPKIIYSYITDEYYLFFDDQNNILRNIRYDGSFNYLNNEQITSSGEIITPTNLNNHIYPDYDILYDTRYGYTIFLAIHLFNNNTVRIYAFDVISTKQLNSLVLVDRQDINLEGYDSQLKSTAGNITTAISLAKDDNYYWLYWAGNTSTDSRIIGMSENQLCYCSAWVNTSECVNNQYRKQTRTCVPTECEDIVQYILDPSCQYVPPPNIENATKFFQNVSACEIHTSELGKSQKCEFNLNVPSQCLLNTVVVTLSGTILSENNQKCDQGSWNISLCNPSFSCNNYGHTCNEFNWTHEYTRYTYKANDQALLQVVGIVPTSCGSWWCGFDRVQAWILSADLKVECQTGCYNHTVCGSGNTFGYSCFERSDCYQESCTFCPLGCRENTGLCVIAGEPSVTPSGVAPQPSSYANPFKFLKDAVEFSFADSTWMLNLISIFLTGGSAVFVGIKAKNWVIALIVAMGVALFFLTMGWLPSWIGIVWVLSIAIVLTSMFREKIVGK
jgi:hypothetical protein